MKVLRTRAFALALLGVCGCHEKRTSESTALYADVQPLFEAACLSCHGSSAPAAGYAVGSHWEVLGCVPENRPATLPASAEAPLVAVLSHPDHARLLASDEQALLASWVAGGAPAFRGTVHPAGIVDPRTSDWHGTLAAHDRFAPLRDAAASDACGRCHAGAPVTPEGVAYPAPAATPCSECHDSEAGALACDTCHGDQGAAYPPRDACYFGDLGPDAHAAHAAGTRFIEMPLACSTCHPTPAADLFSGDHADGQTDVLFADLVDSSFDAESGACAVYCHAQGGNLPMPHWKQDEQVSCQSCHVSPPPDHFPGTCDTCHAEMGTSAESLTPGPLHVNGAVDLGDGSGGCGACHGSAESAAPADSGHALHLASPLTTPLVCADCHPTPATPIAPGHLDGQVDIAFGARASARGQQPVWSTSEQRCTNVACHGAALPGHTLSPLWTDRPSSPSQRCETCHASPPPPPHVARSSCGGSLCHQDEVGLLGSALRISEAGRQLHIDGRIQPP
jgi:predicted CxxxxCH...CXXCH cytochrome family protein